jgi:hypothetical protein
MKKKLSLRDVNMILVVVGLVILVATYFLVYQNYSAKNAELDSQLTEREAHLKELQGYYENLKTYEKGTADGKVNIASNLSKLPRGIKSEDFLVYIMDSTAEVNADVNSVNFLNESEIATFSTVVDGNKKECKGFQTRASFTGQMNYEQLKNYLDYVYNQSDKVTFVDSFVVTYNGGNAKLDTSFSLSKYYITFDGSEYTPVPVPDVSIGVDNPFHTN